MVVEPPDANWRWQTVGYGVVDRSGCLQLEFNSAVNTTDHYFSHQTWLTVVHFLLASFHPLLLSAPTSPSSFPLFQPRVFLSSSCYLDITLTSSRFFCTSLFWWPLTFEPVTTPDMSDTAATVSCTSLPIMNLNVSSGHHFGDRVVFNEPTSSNHTTSYLADWGAGAYFMSG